MAAMMKSMKPEDMVTIISLVQSGKLQLQENDPGGGTESLMRQLQEERRVIDYSHGRSGGGYLEDQPRGSRTSAGDRINEADLRRLARTTGEPRQQDRGGRFFDKINLKLCVNSHYFSKILNNKILFFFFYHLSAKNQIQTLLSFCSC